MTNVYLIVGATTASHYDTTGSQVGLVYGFLTTDVNTEPKLPVYQTPIFIKESLSGFTGNPYIEYQTILTFLGFVDDRGVIDNDVQLHVSRLMSGSLTDLDYSEVIPVDMSSEMAAHYKEFYAKYM